MAEPPDVALRVALGRLGLSVHESALYAALVAHSPASAAWLAKHCGLPRSSTYTALDALVDKGLVGVAHEGEVKQFVVTGHTALVDRLRAEEQRAAERVALAETLAVHFERSQQQGRVPDVVTFEGQEGLKQVYLSMLAELPRQATVRLMRDAFLFSTEWAFVFEEPWRRRVSALKEGKLIETRLLVNDSPEERARESYYQSRQGLHYRFLPRSLQVQRFALYIGGDVIAVMSMEQGQLVGVRIDNGHLARNLCAIFDTLWSIC